MPSTRSLRTHVRQALAASLAALLLAGCGASVATTTSTSSSRTSTSAVVADGTVTITAAGTYVLYGDLDGQVVVDSASDGVTADEAPAGGRGPMG